MNAEVSLMKLKDSMVRVDISNEERIRAYHIAKSRGMTFKGWLGQLIKRELANAEESGDAGR